MAQAPILIVGGGPVGATLALALQRQQLPVTMLEARTQGAAHHDQRALALSYGSRLILERLGVWQSLAAQATPINTIHISQRGSFGRTLLKAQDHDQPALGYVLAYGVLSAALDAALGQQANVQVIYGAEATAILPNHAAATVSYQQAGVTVQGSSPLVVLADGGRSLGDIPGLKRNSKAYGHDALVTSVQCELAHDNIAYERFTPAGPIALLPNGARDFSLVWTGKESEVSQWLDLPDDAFLHSLHAQFGDRVGRFTAVGKRMRFPLKLAYLSPVTAPHLVVIGNAAQTMHPVAGQGFNVGLRDAWELADTVAASTPAAWGAAAMLKAYQKTRRADTKGGIFFTDFLVQLFSNDIVGLSALRAGGLGLVDVVKPLKNRLVGKMSFGAKG